MLQQSPKLALAWETVVASSEPVGLDPMHTYKLYSMGLVQRKDNKVIPRCNLYREYFYRVLSV